MVLACYKSCFTVFWYLKGSPWSFRLYPGRCKCFPYKSCIVFLRLLSVFYLCLWFPAADIWFSLNLPYLECTELLESINLCISPNLGCSQTSFLQIYFPTPFSLCNISGYRYVRDFDIVLQDSEAVFFKLFFLFFKYWIISVDLASNSLTSPFC